MDPCGRTYRPEQVQAIRDAYLLACRTFRRKLTAKERSAIAREVIELCATQGAEDPDKLATRAIVRVCAPAAR